MTVCLYSVIDSVAASHPVCREFESPFRLSSPLVTLSTVLLSPSSNPYFKSFPFHPYFFTVSTTAFINL